MSQERQYLSLEEIQQEELHILEAFDQFCKDNDLNYSIAYGTLLGAIRHSGFIPWDDDIDVTMPRPDFEKLLRSEGPISDTLNLKVVHCRMESKSGYPCAYAKLVNLDIAAEEPFVKYKTNQNLWIDIFPLDAVASKADLKALKARLELNTKLLNIPLIKSQSKPIELAKKILRLFFRDPFVYARNIDSSLNSIDFESSDKIADYVTWIPDGFIPYDKDAALKTISMPFEGRYFPVLSCWEEQLTGFYGDFMRIPPESERITHGFEAWRIAP